MATGQSLVRAWHAAPSPAAPLLRPTSVTQTLQGKQYEERDRETETSLEDSAWWLIRDNIQFEVWNVCPFFPGFSLRYALPLGEARGDANPLPSRLGFLSSIIGALFFFLPGHKVKALADPSPPPQQKFSPGRVDSSIQTATPSIAAFGKPSTSIQPYGSSFVRSSSFPMASFLGCPSSQRCKPPGDTGSAPLLGGRGHANDARWRNNGHVARVASLLGTVNSLPV
ncbi:hypothetical protein S40285_09847 [Stachybotrys chlorohalonatus IBT 40285]|uniref:Uncharacterized protein n=1 Tax=Stachybotrys chlorohalonatus (strain IBT 40285) TaxID=1283841 RepID=A0A084QNG6_STAC4|nr:hypothetical protein S40285_09847 [Stachybotrys chlorohalonata IBT 40285]